MNLTRAQYESAYGRAIVYFSLAIGLATAVQVALMLGASSDTVSTNVWLGVVAGIVLGIVAVFFAAVGSAIVTLVFGILLTVVVARLLRQVASWKAHFVGYFAIGVLAALVPVGLYICAVLSSESPSELTHDWLTILDLSFVLAIAGLSTAFSWLRESRQGSVPEHLDAEVEEVHA